MAADTITPPPGFVLDGQEGAIVPPAGFTLEHGSESMAPAAQPAPEPTAFQRFVTTPVRGTEEAITAVGSRLAGGVAGLGAGITGLVLPGERGQGERYMQRVQDLMSYQPRTRMGQQLTDALLWLPERLSQFSRWAGEKVAGTEHPFLGALTEQTMNLAPMLLAGGARTSLGRVREAPAVAGKGPFVEGTQGGLEPTFDLSKAPVMGAEMGPEAGRVRLSEVAPQGLIGSALERTRARLAAEQSQNFVKDQTWKEAREAGFVVAPARLGRTLETIGGRNAIRQEAINRNQQVVNSLARRAAGLAENEAISDEALAAARESMAGPYREVAAVSQKAANALEEVRTRRAQATQWRRYYDRSLLPGAKRKAEHFEQLAKQWEDVIDDEARAAAAKPDIPADARAAARNLIIDLRLARKALEIGRAHV